MYTWPWEGTSPFIAAAVSEERADLLRLLSRRPQPTPRAVSQDIQKKPPRQALKETESNHLNLAASSNPPERTPGAGYQDLGVWTSVGPVSWSTWALACPVLPGSQPVLGSSLWQGLHVGMADGGSQCLKKNMARAQRDMMS